MVDGVVLEAVVDGVVLEAVVDGVVLEAVVDGVVLEAVEVDATAYIKSYKSIFDLTYPVTQVMQGS